MDYNEKVTKIQEAIGAASMCWKETPKGEFDEAQAGKVADQLINDLFPPSDSPGPYGLLHLGRGSFGQAVQAMKDGFKCCREGWNGKLMYAVIMPGYPDGIEVNEITQKAHHIPAGTKLVYRPYFQLYTAQKDVAMWAPSGSDALANDWLLVDTSI